MPAKQVFTLASSVALAGGAFAFSGVAEAACPTPDPAPAVIPYKNASPSKQACTAADVKAFNDFVKANPNATFKQAEAELAKSSAGCAACVFTKDADATWGPFVYVGNDGDAFTNYGACFERAQGGSAACGQAIQQSELCIAIVCPEGKTAPACTNQNDLNACIKAAVADKNGCGKYDVATACGGSAAAKALDALCDTFDERVAASCMMGGGTDGGTSTSSSSSSSSTSSSSSGSSGASGSSSSGSSGASSSSGDDEPPGAGNSSSSGCTTNGADHGSLAAALAIVGAGLIGATRRRRKDDKRVG